MYNLQYCDGIIIITLSLSSQRLSVQCFQDRSRQLQVEAAWQELTVRQNSQSYLQYSKKKFEISRENNTASRSSWRRKCGTQSCAVTRPTTPDNVSLSSSTITLRSGCLCVMCGYNYESSLWWYIQLWISFGVELMISTIHIMRSLHHHLIKLCIIYSEAVRGCDGAMVRWWSHLLCCYATIWCRATWRPALLCCSAWHVEKYWWWL